MEALYFPKISLPSLAWTYPNLLFFDRIRTIAPAGVDMRTVFDGPTRVLIQEGLVKPLDPNQYPKDEAEDSIAMTYLLGVASNFRKNKQKQIFSRIHLGKLQYDNFTQQLIYGRLLWPCQHGPNEDSDWLEGPSWVISHLMSMIATRVLASHDNLPLITDDNRAKVNIVGNRLRTASATTRRLKAIQRLLPVGPDVNLADIVRFRRRNEASLAEFRRFVTSLAVRSPENTIDDADFAARLRTAEQHRLELVRAVREIQTGRPALDIAISVASLIAPIIERSSYSTVASAIGLSYVLYKSSLNYREKHRVLKDKLVYAALAHQEFTPYNADEILH